MIKFRSKQTLLKALFLAGLIFNLSCNSKTVENQITEKTEAYFKAWNEQEFTDPDFAEFKRDTSYTWHNAISGTGIQSVFNPESGWRQWDRAWNGRYDYRITTIDPDSLMVVGQFHETTDFLVRIGMPEGFSATLTYWFDEDLRVKETLYEWDDSNRSMHDMVKPIVEWARIHDFATIEAIYIKNGFEPNSVNAGKWKTLLDSYQKATGSTE